MTDAFSLREQSVGEDDAVTVAGLFAQVFDLPSVGLDDDFFHLGGDSLIGQSLMTAIEGQFGLTLSLSALFEAPTPRLLAAKVVTPPERVLPPYMTAVRGDGATPSLFCVPGNIGESVAPRKFALSLKPRPIYAFRSVGLEEGEHFNPSMQSIVDDYLAAVHVAQPEGDIVLLGHCAGATIVYEMAQQLAAAGRAPAGLILIDPETMADHAPYLHHSGLKLSLLHAAWRKRLVELEGAIGGVRTPTGEQRRWFVSNGIKTAIGTYVPKPYFGPTLLIHTPERRDLLLQPTRGYPAFVRDLEIVPLSVPHGQMFKDGLGQVLTAVDRFIDRVTVSQVNRGSQIA